ncbi:DUF3466 family protein [Shewanella sp. WXL01]|uniref:DUF3466 family protein n=1 Tax=Shewanella sp. WXL01 TaxID=2709721 RepID=UPI00143856DF|nr:DUF3466 family protein [Shewanella sp. WXL01]NKF51162.1 DUF3466 family protein [Shewanella sp. WXL01]
MKLKLDKALSLVAAGVLASLSSAHAAPVYEIQNITEVLNDETGLVEVDLNGTLENTRNGYGMGLNADNELIGISKGKKLLTDDDINSGIINPEDGLQPEETLTYSVLSPIQANNFTFTAQENDPVDAWTPTFFSIAGTTPPSERDDEGELVVNSIDTYLYGLNNNDTKVGSRSGVEKTLPYEGTDEEQEFWYYRDFEQRGVAVVTGTEYDLIPPYTTYTFEATDELPEQDVELGGYSLLAAVSNNNLAAGYVSTDIAETSKSTINNCVTQAASSAETDSPVPVEACIQNNQYPNSNSIIYIQYQIRAGVWDLATLDANGSPTFTELPLGLEPEENSTATYVAQGLGVNNNGVVVGRSHTYRTGSDTLYQDPAYWVKNDEGVYEHHRAPLNNDQYFGLAYDINDDGLMVGYYQRYIQGYQRNKFFIYDINSGDTEVTTPNDFANGLSELSSYPKDINNAGMVVGNIEVTYEKDKPRAKAAFLYNHNDGDFVNLNNQLTCESKGYKRNDDNNWERHKVTITDGDGKQLTYESSFYLVEANSVAEDGTIVGTAFVRKPEYQYDDEGNLIIGENNRPYFALDGNGNPLTTNIPRMVVLKPASGAEACTVVDDNEDKPYERKGAASLVWLLALPLVLLRRRFFK